MSSQPTRPARGSRGAQASRRAPSPLTAITALLALVLGLAVASPPRAEAVPYRVLVFSKVTNFSHDSIQAGIDAVKKLGSRPCGCWGAADGVRAPDSDLGLAASLHLFAATGSILRSTSTAVSSSTRRTRSRRCEWRRVWLRCRRPRRAGRRGGRVGGARAGRRCAGAPDLTAPRCPRPALTARGCYGARGDARPWHPLRASRAEWYIHAPLPCLPAEQRAYFSVRVGAVSVLPMFPDVTAVHL